MKTIFKITKPGFYRTRDGKKVEVIYILTEDQCRFAEMSLPVIGIREKRGWFRTRTDGANGIEGLANDIIGPWTDRPTVDWDEMPRSVNYVCKLSNRCWYGLEVSPSLNLKEGYWKLRGDSPTIWNIASKYQPTWTGPIEHAIAIRPGFPEPSITDEN
jgi:hypothetical protein